MEEIAERAQKIFDETYTVADILKGNTIEMHQECWDIANHMFRRKKMEKIAEAIDEFRSKNGRQWKSKLRELYYSGKNRNAYLQQFRNRYLPVLDKIKEHTTKREMKVIFEKEDTK